MCITATLTADAVATAATDICLFINDAAVFDGHRRSRICSTKRPAAFASPK